MNGIHPTAIVEPGAQIDESVEIGPYAIVGPHVTIGARTTIGSHSVIEGHTTLGEDNRIGHYASVGGRPQDMKYKDEPTKLVIGSRNTIREFTTIHTGTVQDVGVTTLGDDNWIMAYVHIGHDCTVGNHVILSSNAQMAGHVEIGDWAIIGGMSGVHQFVRIGAHSMLGGASALVQDIPPFVIAAGNKAEPHGINVGCAGAVSRPTRSPRCAARTACCTRTACRSRKRKRSCASWRRRAVRATHP